MATWPDATNTGVPKGVTLLPSGSIVVTKPGTVISGLDIKGSIIIQANNVTIENCKVTSTDFHGVWIKEGFTGAVIKNCEVNGNGGHNAIFGSGTFLNNNVYAAENGIALQGDNSVIKGNYIHDLYAPGAPHYDGIEINGGNKNIEISGNTIVNNHDQTSAVMIDNYFGPISNIKVDGNLLVGGGYSIYVDGQFNSNPIDGVSITNNHLGKGTYGTTAFTKSNPYFSGNFTDGWEVAKVLGNQPGGGGTTTPPPTDGGSTTPPPIDDGSTHIVTSGPGKDVLNGTSGVDIFKYNSLSDSGATSSTRDVINNFTPGQDKIDLSAIDANTKVAGNQEFTFLATNGAAFTGKAGELAWRTEGNKTIIQVDVDGDKWTDMEIELSGAKTLKATDFIGVAGSSTTPPTTPPPVTGVTLTGTTTKTVLVGGDGNDTLISGPGKNTMTGGAGNDVFKFNKVSDIGSSPSTRDVITDFKQGQDKIDLSAIDANTKVTGDQAFTLLTANNSSFHKVAGELAWRTDNGHTIIQGDINGDGVHDFEIDLVGTINLTKADFIL